MKFQISIGLFHAILLFSWTFHYLLNSLQHSFIEGVWIPKRFMQIHLLLLLFSLLWVPPTSSSSASQTAWAHLKAEEKEASDDNEERVTVQGASEILTDHSLISFYRQQQRKPVTEERHWHFILQQSTCVAGQWLFYCQ